MKIRSTQKYCAPTLELRFSHFGFSGSAGGLTGFGPTWQKPQDMPTRYGRTRSCRVVVVGIGVIALRVPLLRRLFVEVGIREQPQTDDAGRVAVKRADRRCSCRARRSSTPGYFCLVLKRIRRAVRPRACRAKAEAIRVGAGCLLETGLVDQAEIVPAIVAAELRARMRGDRLQEIRARRSSFWSMASQKRSLPPVQTIHMLRPLISSAVRRSPPSMS